MCNYSHEHTYTHTGGEKEEEEEENKTITTRTTTVCCFIQFNAQAFMNLWREKKKTVFFLRRVSFCAFRKPQKHNHNVKEVGDTQMSEFSFAVFLLMQSQQL